MVSLCLTAPHVAGQTPTFRAGTDAVAVNVSVKQGPNPVAGLSATDFRLTDNDVPQEVAAVSLDAVPVDLTIVVDTGLRSFVDLESARAAVRGMAAFLRPADRFRVLTTGNSVVTAIPWRRAGGVPDTSSIQVVEGAFILVAVAGGVALFHRTPPDHRHLVVVLTEGLDICSLVSGDALEKAAQRSGAVLHWINVQLESQKKTTPMSQGPHAACRWADDFSEIRPSLSEAVRLTGGSIHTTWYKAATVSVDAFDEIFDDFRKSYILHYVPAGVERSGWHKLAVTVLSKKYTIRARPGYWGPK
jgi:hypothetical protein